MLYRHLEPDIGIGIGRRKGRTTEIYYLSIFLDAIKLYPGNVMFYSIGVGHLFPNYYVDNICTCLSPTLANLDYRDMFLPTLSLFAF